MEALDWQAPAEAASDAVAEALAPRLKKATDDLYGDLLYTVQDYLKENVLHNVQAEIEGANRQALHDRQRAIKAEANVAALVEALKGLWPDNLRSVPDHLPDDFVFPIDVTAGELRRAEAALSQALGGE